MINQNEANLNAANDRFGRLGTLALVFGLALIVARAVENSHGFPAMPRFWYQNDSLWWLVGLTSVGAGSWLLGKSENKADPLRAWNPTTPGRRFHELVIYTRQQCPLCDEAQEQVNHYSRWLPPVTAIDIDADPVLVQRYGTCVPVVAMDGKVRFKGRVNEILLRRLIEGTPPIHA